MNPWEIVFATGLTLFLGAAVIGLTVAVIGLFSLIGWWAILGTAALVGIALILIAEANV